MKFEKLLGDDDAVFSAEETLAFVEGALSVILSKTVYMSDYARVAEVQKIYNFITLRHQIVIKED